MKTVLGKTAPVSICTSCNHVAFPATGFEDAEKIDLQKINQCPSCESRKKIRNMDILQNLERKCVCQSCEGLRTILLKRAVTMLNEALENGTKLDKKFLAKFSLGEYFMVGGDRTFSWLTACKHGRDLLVGYVSKKEKVMSTTEVFAAVKQDIFDSQTTAMIEAIKLHMENR